MGIANILFDLDGTLVDSAPGIEYSLRAATQVALPGREVAAQRHRIGPPLRSILRQAFGDLGADKLAELEQCFRVSYDKEGWLRSAAYPGVAATLRRLLDQGVSCFVVTNKPLTPAQRILDHLELRNYFRDVVSPNSKDPPFASKVDAAAYVVDRYGLQRDRTVFVGDSEDDLHAARGCGLAFVAAAYGYGNARTGCEGVETLAVLSKFGELSGLVSLDLGVGASTGQTRTDRRLQPTRLGEQKA